jgi:cell wall-associated NlpC family hydrolase
VVRTLLIGAASLSVLAPTTVAHADPTLAEIEAQLDTSNKDLEATIEAYNAINIDLAASQAKAAELANRLKPLEDGVAAANANVELIAVTAFKNSGNLRTLSVVLGAQSSGSLMDQLSTLQQISHQQQKNIQDLKTARSKFDDEKKTLDETLAAQNTQKADLENKRKKIDGDVKKLDDLKKRATNAGAKPKAVYNPGPLPTVSGKAGVAVAYAEHAAAMHYDYVYGKAGPTTFDCSGLTMAAWGAAGVKLDHNAARQWKQVTQFHDRSKLQPGDLVFYNGLGHVAIYIGADAVVHAPHPGEKVQRAAVNVDSIVGYGRVKG